jgi:ribosome-associated toxin RatA of RatAB toxin-antitoxin module
MRGRVERAAVVPYSARAMFNLVNDVARYPEFLPYCRSAAVLEHVDDRMLARIELAKGALRKSFTTRNRLLPDRSIRLELVEGPFRSLQGLWTFEDLTEFEARVALDLEFEFTNRLIALAVGPVFHHLANSLVDAFVQRARQLQSLPTGNLSSGPS